MAQEQLVSSAASREKLGLSLAGGGFRASLFHLGVLRRMAELDVLRRVEVLSTVSGGSIVGALYVLLLKKHLERARDGNLGRDQYVEIIDELEEALLSGIRKNLRNRLLMNPLGVLRVLLTSRSLGERMARLYERHLFSDVVEEIVSRPGAKGGHPPGRLPLTELRIRPGGDPMERGIEEYNRSAVEEGRSVSTRLVLNATSLNSGARFWFSSSEVGDWDLGHVRHSEVRKLLDRKERLEIPMEELEARFREAEAEQEESRSALSLALWWRSGSHGAPPPGGHWDPLFRRRSFPGRLVHAEHGLLRQAKNPAWYLRVGSRREPAVTGGRSESVHWSIIWETLERIDGEVADSLRQRQREDPDFGPRLLDFLLEFYWLRSAEVASDRIDRFWRNVSVGDAVGASADFPPVFPPYQVLGLYDDLHVSRLGLTDGGVFDNMGLTALAEEGCTQIIASDTSGLFEDVERVSNGRLTMMSRIVSVLQKVVASEQREGLRERRRVSRAIERHPAPGEKLSDFLAPRRLSGLAYFHIDSPPVEPPGPAPFEAFDRDQRRMLAALRTDLDAFGEVEIAGLVNHGYGTADRYIRRYFSEEEMSGSEDGALPMLSRSEYWTEAPKRPMPLRVDPGELRRTLEAGRSRFFRALKVFAPLSWAFTLALAAAFVWWTWDLTVTGNELLVWLGDASLSVIEAMAPWLAGGWTAQTFSVGKVVVGVLLVLVVLPRATGFDLVDWLERRGRRSPARRLASASKWMRALWGNLLWILGAFPVVLALAVSLLAVIGDFFFTRPYLRATRNR